MTGQIGEERPRRTDRPPLVLAPQKMLGQQLRRMESDGIVVRKAYPEVPPRVEYSLTAWGQALCPALDAMLKWVDLRQQQ